jgi:hypothetical protein
MVGTTKARMRTVTHVNGHAQDPRHDRYDELCRAYAKLPNRRESESYSSRALRIVPRYQVVQAMLVEVERLDPDHMPDIERPRWTGPPTPHSRRSPTPQAVRSRLR